MPYYTGTGDKGMTGVCGGGRVSKASPRIDAIGEVDELNSVIGLCRVKCRDKDIEPILERVQRGLFILGADLSTPLASKNKTKRIDKKHVKWMGDEIKEISKEIGKQKGFILPGGSILAARLHIARAVCRRAERAIVVLSKKEKINPLDIPYINRMSALLFVLARMANKRARVEDVEWKK